MNRYFAETYYYIALLSERDEAHTKAVHLNSRLTGEIVTTQWVLTEVGDALCNPDTRSLFLDLLELLESDGNTTIVEADSELFRRGVTLFSQRPDKDWSLTDCMTFVVMEELGLAEALTADHHFEQAGFVALFR